MPQFRCKRGQVVAECCLKFKLGGSQVNREINEPNLRQVFQQQNNKVDRKKIEPPLRQIFQPKNVKVNRKKIEAILRQVFKEKKNPSQTANHDSSEYIRTLN